MAQSELNILIKATDQASKTLDGVAQKAGGLGSALGGLGKVALGVGAAGIAAVGAGAVVLGGALADATREAMAAEEVQAQLNAVLTSTGGVAGVTAQAANDLATALSQVTRFDDETVLSAENLLLTFTNIGKDVFPDVTAMALDMATALGTDAKSAALQLGKAMQDPVGQATALRRAGVNLTDGLQDQIKTMVESGDLIGAQNLLLQELQTEFGGAAVAAGSTAAGQFDIFNNTVGNLKETVGTALLPALTELGGKLTEALNKPEVQAALAKLADKLGELAATVLPPLIDFLTGPAVDAFVAVLNILSGQGGGGGLSKALQDVATFVKPITDAMGPAVEALNDLWNAVSPILIPALERLGAIITTVILPLFRDQLLNMLTTLIGAFIGFVTFLTGVVNMIVGLFTGDMTKAREGAQQVVSGILKIFESLGRGVLKVVVGIVGAVIAEFEQLGIDIVTPVQEVWTAITDTMKEWPDKMLQFGKDLIGGMVEGIKSVATDVGDAIGGALDDAWNFITGQEQVQSPSRHWAWLGEQLGLGLVQGIRSVTGVVQSSVKDTITATFRTWYDALKDHFGGAASNLRRMFQGYMRDWLSTATVGIGETTADLVRRMLRDVAAAGGPAMQAIVAQFGQQFVDLLGAAGGLPGTGTAFSGIDAIMRSIGVVSGLGSAAATRYEETFIRPMRERLAMLEAENGELGDILETKRMIAEAEERMLALQKQQQDLQWLSAQLDLIKLIRENGLNAQQILGNLTLGIGADPAAILEAMTRAMQQMLGQAQASFAGLGAIMVDSIPSWLIPGSPTPFEKGLRGIGNALNGLSLTGGGGLQPAFAMAGGGGAGVYNVTVQYAPVFSAVDRREAEYKLRPLLESAIRKVVEGR